MALTACPDCSAPVSDRATMCLHCGRPIAESIQDATPVKTLAESKHSGSRPAKVVWLILALSIVVFAMTRTWNSTGPAGGLTADVPPIATAASVAFTPTPEPTPEVYLDAGRLRLLGRSAALQLVKTSGVWTSIDHKPVDRQTGEELVDLRAADGMEGLLVLEKGRVTMISLTIRRALPPGVDPLSLFNIYPAEGTRQNFPAGFRWRNPKGPIKLIDVTTFGAMLVTVDFVSATRYAG